MREHISMGGFSLPIGWPGGALESPGFQDFGAQHLKAEAPRVALRGLNQPIQSFGVSVADAMIEIGKDGFMPVAHGGQQGLECRFQMGRNAGFPVLIRGFCLGALAFQPDGKKAFLEPIGGFQVREVLCPGFQDQPLGLVQIAVAMQENVTVVHQPAPGGIGKFCSKTLAYRFKAFICHLHNVKVVNDHLGVWQDELRGVKVRTPHVHANQANLILMGQTVQITGHSGFVPVPQKIDNATVADVAHDATWLVEQVNFIDAECGTGRLLLCSRVFGGLGKDAPDGSFIDAYIIRHVGKGAFERLLSEIEHQALRHCMALIHIVEWLKEGSIARTAAITLSDHQDTRVLAPDGDVHEQLAFDLVAVQVRASAMQAAQNSRPWFGGDLVTVCVLFYAQNAPVCPSQNIQRSSPMLQVVESLFFLVWINAVKEGGKVKRLHYHSTRYADFCIVSMVGLIPRDMPNSRHI